MGVTAPRSEALTPQSSPVKFVLLPSPTEQLINGDDEIIDPAVCLFEHTEYAVKMPDGRLVNARVSLEDGRLMAEVELDEAVDFHAALEMHGVHQVTVCAFAHVREVHVTEKRKQWIM